MKLSSVEVVLYFEGLEMRVIYNEGLDTRYSWVDYNWAAHACNHIRDNLQDNLHGDTPPLNEVSREFLTDGKLINMTKEECEREGANAYIEKYTVMRSYR